MVLEILTMNEIRLVLIDGLQAALHPGANGVLVNIEQASSFIHCVAAVNFYPLWIDAFGSHC
jgi:hypothetical protein